MSFEIKPATRQGVVFDIETIPQNERLILARAPEFRAPSTWKDPEKIARAIAEKRDDYIRDAALDWKTCEIALIGLDDGGGYFSYGSGDEKHDLTCVLSAFNSAILAGVPFGGHNVKGFDLPMIVNRARVHGLSLPSGLLSFWHGRPQWHEFVFDTLDLINMGSREGNGVQDVAKALDLPPKLGNGSDFHLLWKADKESAIAYNRRDVEIEVAIAKFCGVK